MGCWKGTRGQGRRAWGVCLLISFHLPISQNLKRYRINLAWQKIPANLQITT
ncbi:MAG: hypothetical protein KME31_07315 [Tolypothrix carrinoi HA7290-LM1]|nr:hypothetical protein [Tolypothrix carrinoi HA7290-LM1]